MENCKWRLKVNNGEIVEFSSEEDVKKYIAANRNKYNWETDPELIKVTTENYIDNIVQKAKQDIYFETAKITPLKNRNLAISEDQLEEGDSDTIAVTDVITKPNKDGKRLAPEVIAENYEIGAKLPSILELSKQLDLSPNTIRKAFHNLAKEGYLAFSRGRYGGTFVIDIPETGEQAFKWLAVNPKYAEVYKN